MKYLLDTDTIAILYDNKREENLMATESLDKLQNTDVLFISVLSLFELEYSFFNAQNSYLQKQIRNLINTLKLSPMFNILHLEPDTAQIYGKIKSSLRNQEKITRNNIKKHNIDIMIASIALYEKCILVSGDNIYQMITKHKPALKLETWW